MRRYLLMVLLLAGLVSVSLPGLSAQERPPESVLQVVDSMPLSGEELGLQSDITVYFDRPLDCATVSSAVSVTPTVRGNVTCGAGDTSLVFAPGAPFQRGTEYTLMLSDALRGKDGSMLLEPYKLTLNTVGFLQVSQVLPSDGTTEVAADSIITVIFNRPVVPLVSIEEMDALPNPLTIIPAVKGKGEWLNTSIYVFRPEGGLAGGTNYNVAVNAGLQAVDGSVLEEQYSWSFRTIDPQVLEIYPRDLADGLPLDVNIQVTFNQPMDEASVEKAFTLRKSDTQTSLSGTFEWSEDSTGFMFDPSDLLELDRAYEILIESEGVLGKTGGQLRNAVSTTFVTVPLPAIVGTDPFDGQKDVAPYGGFTVYFASPMDQKTFKDKFTIDPKPWRDPNFYYYEYGNSLSVSFPTEPSTKYSITIAPGMADKYGNKIESSFSFGYTTGPYPSDLQLQVPGAIGFYNAAREKTQLFLTHTNLTQINLELYSVPLEDFIQQAASREYYSPAEGYFPDPDNLLRSWQIDATADPNVMEYKLLDLGAAAGGAAVDCPGSPKSRLKVGDTAIVISDPDPVRGRSHPPDGEIVELMYKGYSLPVVGGPVCANNILWWEVRLRDERTAWVAEGLGEEYFLDVRIAANTTPVAISATTDGGALQPGLYFLIADSPETSKQGYSPQRHFMVVATANLTVKSSVDSMTVWATNAQTGLPIGGAQVIIYDGGFNVLASGTTDASGLAQIATPRVTDLYVPRVAVLRTNNDFGLALTSWTDGIEPWQFGQNYNFYPQRYRVYLYTDRPIYRPDQPVYFKGIVRSRDDVTYTPPDMRTVPVKIYDDQGQIIYNKDVALTPFGTFSDQINLAKDAPLGYYRISVELPSEYEYQSEGGSVSFSVAEFRVPEFQVEVEPEEREVVQGGTVKILVNSTYFFGGPVSNANVDYQVVAERYFFNYTGRGYYDFVDYNYDEGPGAYYGYSGGQVASGTTKTDERGMALIEIPAELTDSNQSQTFTIEATVSDESQQYISGRTSVIVHQGLVYIGARPKRYVGFAGEENTFDLIAVDWDSEAIANQDISYEIVERRWSSVQEEDDSGRTTWTWSVEEIPVTSGKVTTDADGKASVNFTPPNGGIFKIKITTRDSAGNEVVASTTTWISSRQYVSWRQQNSNRIDLISGQTEYSVGDTAEILIASPFQGTVEALVTVERGDVLKAERITMDTNSYVYRLPIEADYAPNVYVSVVLIKGVDENNKVAAFRMGMIQLGVDTEQKVINIEITSNKEQAAPRETVTYTVRTTDYKGDPVQAEVGVGVTDLASLSIVGPNSEPLLSYFYGRQGLGIRTATPLTINTDQLTQTTLDTIKGGGGGAGLFGIIEVRGDFRDTAYWNGALVTGPDGTATFDVKLPDNLTTWRLDARAVTSGADGLTLVGQNTFDLLSTKPLLIRPATPRFFVVGDEVVLAAVVNNNTRKEQDVEVTLTAEGVQFADDATQRFTIPAGGRQRIEWKVTVQDVANVDLTFIASGNNGEFTDASKPPIGQGDDQLLPVYKYEAPETVGTGGVLREAGSRTEAIVLPRRFDVTQGELTVKVEPSLAATTIDGLDYLKNYPHQCTEQTVSRFLPNIMTYRALKNLGLSDPKLEANLNLAVEFALQRLYAAQKVDGGWGWFVQDTSNPLTTAYALIGLTEAKKEGFTVDDGVIQRAQNFLRTSFIVPGLNTQRWQLNRQVFVLYALARSGDPDVSRTVTMFENRQRLSLYTKGFLMQTFQLIDPSDTSRTEVLLSDLINSAVLSATGAHWEEDFRDYWNWNSDTRTTAIVLEALVKQRPDSDLIPNVVRWLMVARRADAWETTQETAWAVMALTDWMVASGELKPDYTYSVSINGSALTTGTATPETVRDRQTLVVQVSDLLKDEANKLVLSRSQGDGVLYYTAHLRAFLPVPEIEPVNRGIIIERRYTLLNDPNREPITEARVGDVVQVRLTVIAPNDLYYVVIEDPIPAGAEGINPNLQISQQIGTQPGLDSSDPLSYGWGWWWFSNIEFRDEKVVLYSTYLPAGTYEYVYTIRPGLEGTYNVIPATGQEFYFPEVYGRSAGSTFTILPLE